MKRPRQVDNGDERFRFSPAHRLPCQWVAERPDERCDIYAIRLRKPYVALAAFSGVRLVLRSSATAIEVVPDAAAGRFRERITLLDRVYYAYETHALALDEGETTVLAIYVRLETPAGATGEQLRVDAECHWLGTRFPGRYVPLPWFPPDVDPTRYGLRVDATRIPQRSPLWFRVRGIGGTKASTLLGYWVPTKEADPQWTLHAEKVLGPAALDAAALGTQSEGTVTCGYLAARPTAVVSAVGWCDAPPALGGGGSGWGASPDGLIHDSTMTWDAVPEDIRKYLHPSSPRGGGMDPARGVLEIKTSRRHLSMEPYFLPQVYMEMLAARAIWCDLVRYRPPAHATALGVARIYRVYRHQPTADLITGLMRAGLAATPAALQDMLLSDERWVQARTYLSEVARALPYEEITVAPTHDAEWRAYREALLEGPMEEEEEDPEDSRDSSIRGALKKMRDAVDTLESLLQ